MSRSRPAPSVLPTSSASGTTRSGCRPTRYSAIRSACRSSPDTFEMTFRSPVTIIVGENGAGKSTLLEAIAALVLFDEAGGAAGHRPVGHAEAIEAMGGELATALRASWLPRMNKGWFFRAESFFSVARYVDRIARDVGAPPPDFLSHSHGEGFLRFFEERCRSRGIYIFDEPESALSPLRQLAFLRLLARMDRSGQAQVILATHAPILMAYPGANLLAMSDRGFEPVGVEERALQADAELRSRSASLRRPRSRRRRRQGSGSVLTF